MIDLDAIRERDANVRSLTFGDFLDDGDQAQIDRRALLAYVYELAKQRAMDVEEIRRLTIERDSAREALRVSEQHVREIGRREYVVYRNCPKHLSIPWTTIAVPTGPPSRTVCPHCAAERGQPQ